MKMLLGFGGGYGRIFLMSPADGGDGGGGAGGADGGAGGAGAGAGGAGGGGGSSGTGGGADGGTGGGDGGTGTGGMFSGQGGTGDGGTGTAGGALAGGGKGGAGEGGAGEIDWEKITDDEFFGKVQFPEVEGVTIGKDYVKQTYGEFIRKHHISPDAVADFLKLEGGNFRKAYDETMAKQAEETKAIKENFDAQGAELKKTYTPQQIETAVGALAKFSDDKDFMQVATTNLSNNKTLVKLLLNWAEHNAVDDTAGAGQGQGSGGLAGFAERWTGKKI